MQIQQLESTLLWCFQRTLYLLFVKDGSQLARCLQIVVGTVQQALLLQVVAYRLKVQRVQHTRVLINLLDVWIHTVLTYLVTYQRHRNVFCSLAVVAFKVGHTLIKHALPAHPSVVRPLGNKNIILGLLLYAVSFLKGKGRCYVKVSWVLLLHVMRQLVQKVEVGLQLVTTADDAQRWMVAVVADDVVELLIQELGGSRILVHRKRPVGQLHLAVESHLIRHTEGSLGRAPRVETQVVQAVLAGGGKHLHPAALIRWRRAC